MSETQRMGQEPGRQAYRNRCSSDPCSFPGETHEKDKTRPLFSDRKITVLSGCYHFTEMPCFQGWRALGNRLSQFEIKRSITLFWNRHTHVPCRYPPCQYLSRASHGICQSRGSTPWPVTIKNIGKILY